MMKLFSLLSFLLGCYLSPTYAATSKYRVMFGNDPATTMTIGWDQESGTNAIVYYDTIDRGIQAEDYAFRKEVDARFTRKSMDNTFARLTNLSPNTVYYFVIKDSEGVSRRFSFRTISNNPTDSLSLVAGGDSRGDFSGVQVPNRVKANQMVAKLRPHAVIFGGDFTINLWPGFVDDNEWTDWFNDWQHTIGPDGRMVPIVVARGNHERSNEDVSQIFDVRQSDIYYDLTFGGNLLRIYTLNSEINPGGNQAVWLKQRLENNTTVKYNMVQYHRPIRPHVASKSEQIDQYQAWAKLFYDYGVDVVLESDAHVVKTTWPLRPCNSDEQGCEEGFIQDDCSGVVFVGEGTWGVGVRSPNDTKSWTRSSGAFTQFKLIFVNQHDMEMRTIRVDNVSEVGQSTDESRFDLPVHTKVWDESGGFIRIPSTQLGLTPAQGAIISGDTINIVAQADQITSPVRYVDIFVDGVRVFRDSIAPYTYDYVETSSVSSVRIQAVAVDNAGACYPSPAHTINRNNINVVYQINADFNDAEERIDNGCVSIESSDLEMIEDGGANSECCPLCITSTEEQLIGLRFTNINIPSNAIITSARLQFTAVANDDSETRLIIKAEDVSNSDKFANQANNISGRQTTLDSIFWEVGSWSTGQTYMTPDIRSLLSTIVSKADWNMGNAISFLISGSGEREAHSFDGDPSKAVKLFVEYMPSDIQKPNLGSDIRVCFGEKVILDAGAGYTSYRWNGNTSLSGRTLEVTQSGTYIVEVRGGHSSIKASDTINVHINEPLSIDLGPDITSVEPVTLSVSKQFALYNWSTGVETPTITVDSTGKYILRVEDTLGCSASDDIQITIKGTNIKRVQDKSHFELNVFPNPVLQTSVIAFSLPRRMYIDIKVIDQTGKIVDYMYKGRRLTKGTHTLMFNRKNTWASGRYTLYMNAEGIEESVPMVIP